MARVYKHLENFFPAPGRFRRHQSYPPVVSIGATPTCSVILNTEPVTVIHPDPTTYKARFLSLLVQPAKGGIPWEIHPGNYTLYDTMQEEIGACQQREIAGSVLARVISTHTHTQRDTQRVLIDTGGAALSKEKGGGERAWGEIVCGKGKGKGKELLIKSVSQECAVVVRKDEGEEGGGGGGGGGREGDI
jgi:D-serine deaminase-like pyridoxal phosphate-dependent protein